MNSTTQSNIEVSAILNLIPYLDTDFNYSDEKALKEIVDENESKFAGNKTFELLKNAVYSNPDYYGNIVLVDQSSTNSTQSWKDDLIQGCTFRDPNGNYFVAYRGTGDGRWPDNGNGMTAPSTEMQEAAKEYFDEMAEKYFIDAKADGKQVYVTGHSKGGNEAQYVFMSSEYEHLIDGCYNLDGQGFSEKAVEDFKERYGEEYDEKLSKMYSVCGEDDFVHDLGIVIIPEENTYFVKTSGNDFASLHALDNMLGDGEGSYGGLDWNKENGQIVHGEQGDIGKLVKKLSATMMQMDEEDLNGAALALMSFIDPYSNEDILGSLEITWKDYVDFAAHGVPAIIETLLFTKEGNKVLSLLVESAADYLNEKFGPGGVVVGFALGTVVLTFIVAPLLISAIVLANIVDFIVDAIDKIKEIAEKIKAYISGLKEFVASAVKKIYEFFNSLTSGYRYASEHPQIVVDTYKLRNYADRIQGVNRRIGRLDQRMDNLYWQVGLADLWSLVQADWLTKYSKRLEKCAGYLNDTASEFERCESELIGSI